MGTTTIHGLRYPEAADPADVPTDMNELATDVDNALPPVAVNGRWLKGGASGAMSWQPIAVGDLSFAGQPNGVATLDSGGKVPAGQLPAGAAVFAYNQFTGNVSVNTNTEATAVQIVASTSVTYPASTPVLIEFFAPAIVNGANASSRVVLTLWDGSTDLGIIGQLLQDTAASAQQRPVYLQRQITPSAAAHVFSIRGHIGSSDLAGTVVAGAGGAPGVFVPGFIRVKAA